MDTMVPQAYMVRLEVFPELMGRNYLETYFTAGSDRDAIQDAFSHGQAVTDTYTIQVVRLEVFAFNLGPIKMGVATSGLDRLLYDSDNLEDSIEKNRPDFIQRESHESEVRGG